MICGQSLKHLFNKHLSIKRKRDRRGEMKKVQLPPKVSGKSFGASKVVQQQQNPAK